MSAEVHGQWLHANGPRGGWGTLLFENDGVLFGVVQGRCFQSTDNGMGWSEIDSALPDVRALAASGANFFAGCYDNGVLVSTDWGTS